MKLILTPSNHFHFLGIGGAGMSALAAYLLDKGCTVSGTDIKKSATTDFLESKGATVFIGHKVSNLDGAQVLVVSSAIQDDNPEVVVAKKLGVFILRRAEMLSYLMDYCANRVAVAGTHGKTTTTAFITHLFRAASLTPHVIVGSGMRNDGKNYAVGTSPYFIAEADESDGSFLCLHANCCVVTNLEEDHMNYFKTREVLIDSFRKFIHGVVSRKGLAVLNGDDPNLRKLASEFDSDYICLTGVTHQQDVWAEHVEFDGKGSSFTIVTKADERLDVQIPMFGMHNVYNALTAFAVARHYGLSFDALKQGLATFKGTARRLDIVGEENGILVFDDYGHHPTEIQVTLSGLKKGLGRRIVCVFQPHRYSRTKDLFGEFSVAFSDADSVVLTDIYSANEEPITGISSEGLVHLIRSNSHPDARCIAKDLVAEVLANELQPGDVVVTMGAGDIGSVGYALVEKLKEKSHAN